VPYQWGWYITGKERREICSVKWTPDLIIALVLVVGCFVLLGLGIDGEVKSILTMAGGWVFGSQYQLRRQKLR
jgi:hypothetical protein